VYRDALLQCISFGLRRYRDDAAKILADAKDAFHIYSWTHEVYGEFRDIGLDLEGIGALLAAPDPGAEQRAAIDALSRRLVRIAHRVGDRIPTLGRLFANDRQRMMLSEARDYLRDRGGAGSRTRAGLVELLADTWSADRRLVIVGHSLGSVIAYDTLWELSAYSPLRVALFVTIGSPLGTRFVRRLVRGADKSGSSRFPSNMERWTNIAAKGELTALYPRLRNVYGAMLELGMLSSFEDHVDIYNHFVGASGLNVHSEYGYLIQREFAEALAGVIAPQTVNGGIGQSS
jgi:pimeloyl-ACP methyl ester carboxylesterase